MKHNASQLMEFQKLTIITSHVNTDYDAISSMLAAQKLYPGARVVFPGSHEKNLRNFFVQSMVYLFNMADINTIDLSTIKRLVLVDTRSPARIGKLAEIIDKPDLEIHIYDHHPPVSGDIEGEVEVFYPAGATVSILIEILKQKQIDISPQEATVMGLGIYEDTGSFTYSSTTEKDFLAAAFLVSKGADLNTIADIMTREISSEHIGLLNDLLEGAERYTIQGVDVVISRITTDHYVPDFAVLVQKMMKMENISALFVIASMEKKIYIVARSNTSDVDVGAILRLMGGGGHAVAASATLKDKTMTQAEQELTGILHRTLRSGKRARDLMASPPIKTGPDVTCEEARNMLARYNVNALLVTESHNGKDNLLGYITRPVIEKALFLKLDHEKVREYMTTDVGFVGPDAELPEIQKPIIENKQRILPVVENGSVIGVITRTDLFTVLMQQTPQPFFKGSGMNGIPDPLREDVNARMRNIVRFMRERLSKRIMELLASIGEVGDRLGYGIYVVGGFVRDLFLYRHNEDVDIVVEGDGIGFAKIYASMKNARMNAHQKFGTAVIILPDGFKIDVATARMEYYRFPADMPNVEMSSIKLDLYRRDFTINTLAIQLNPARFGTLIDFFSAQRDIKENVIRVLHNLSFVEDPTRVFRAIRFEQRFGFTIGKHTAGLIRNVIKSDFFRKLSGKRVFTELKLILEEENPLPAIKRLQDYDLLSFIHPSIRADLKLISLFSSVKEVLSWHNLLFLGKPYTKWAVYFLVMIRNTDTETCESICDKFELAPRFRTLFCKERFEAERRLYQLKTNSSISNSQLYQILSNLKIELILYIMAVSRDERIKKAISHYFMQLQHVKILIGGNDLKSMGIEPGPIYRETLQSVLNAKLDGWVKTREEELEFVKAYISQIRSEQARDTIGETTSPIEVSAPSPSL